MPDEDVAASVRSLWAKACKKDPELKTPPPPDADSLLRFEAEAGFSAPADWVKWLQICNGCPLNEDFWVSSFYGIWDRPIRQLDLDASRMLRQPYFTEWRRLQRTPIADDGCGDYYLLGQPFPGGPPCAVVFWDQSNHYHEFEYVVATDLWVFLRAVLEHLDSKKGWPFNKRTLFSIDPAMASIPEKFRPDGDE